MIDRPRHGGFARRQQAKTVLVSLMAAALSGTAVLAAETRAVIELFTSQGCSSCPPADKLLGEMASDPHVIALSLPVDYWDYLGWKDTLASPEYSARQRAYSRARGDRDVFTPQAVVNGLKSAIGSNAAAIEAAAHQTHQGPVLTVPVTAEIADGALAVALPASADQKDIAEVWLLAVQGRATVNIGRGENSNRTVTYHNVVRRITRLGHWDGKAARFSVPLPVAAGVDCDLAAILVQDGSAEKPGAIRGAALARLR